MKKADDYTTYQYLYSISQTSASEHRHDSVVVICIVLIFIIALALCGFIYIGIFTYSANRLADKAARAASEMQARADKMINMINKRESVTEIGQIAFDADEELGYTVYIDEDGETVPYLVLTNDYSGSGNTLLLRKPLCAPRIFNELDWDRQSGIYQYYPGSDIDKWLVETFGKKLRGVNIVPSAIEVPTYNSPSAPLTTSHISDIILLR